MTKRQIIHCCTFFLIWSAWSVTAAPAAESPVPPKAFIDGSGADWIPLGKEDFVNVNCDDDTWTWTGGEAHCTGRPVGVIRSTKQYTNFELVVEWRHLRAGGNSGVFVWTIEKSLVGERRRGLRWCGM